MNQKTITGLKMNNLGNEEGKRGNSEIGRMMNLAGFNGSNPIQSSYGFQEMMMNMQNQTQQPQIMYQRTPFVPPNTGYYYNYCPAPAPQL